MPELVDKVALVTGASSGIGEAIAVELAKAAMRLCLTGRNVSRLETLTREINSHGGHAVCLAADLANPADRDAVSAWALEAYGGVDLLVHAAGIAHGGCSEMPDEVLEDMLRINMVAAHGLVRRVRTSLIERGGQIAFINSRAGFNAGPDFGGYGASKHALRGYADSLRAEMRPHGVRVLSVFPGKVDTPLLREVHAEVGMPYEAEKYARPEDIARATLDALMVPRHVEIPEVTVRPFRE